MIKNPRANAGLAEGSIPGLGRYPGEGNGNLLKVFRENPMNRRDWQATAHGVANSRTQLSIHTSASISIFHMAKGFPLCYILSNMDISGLVWTPDLWKLSSLGFSQEPSSGPTTATSPSPLWGGTARGAACFKLVPVFFHKAGSLAPPGSVTSSLLTLIGCFRGTLVSAEWAILFLSSSSSETFSSIKCCGK